MGGFPQPEESPTLRWFNILWALQQEEDCAKFVLEYFQFDGINGNNRINRIEEKLCKNKYLRETRPISMS